MPPMQYFQQAAFALITAFAIWLFAKNILKIRRNILLGKDESLTDQPRQRWKQMLLLAFGQKKMFRNPLVAVLHFVVYAGFIIINLEVMEIAIDGIFGTHRIFWNFMGGTYSLFIDFFEILAVLVTIFCAVFLLRRNVVKVKRLAQSELNGWPKSDANYILITEIVLMCLFLTMNSADRALQVQHLQFGHYKDVGAFLFSGQMAELFKNLSPATLVGIERTCWWLHIVGIFAFLNYLPYSKHLHILFAFPNAYYARLFPKGEIKNMPQVQNEVKYMMQPELAPTGDQPPVKFGARDVPDLSWKNILDAYSCTECGRCTAACPANITGKLLSPRKIMMATRDRAEEIGRNLDAGKEPGSDGKALLHDYITVEELRACTTCNACVEECPVSINPLDIILELRRSLIMEESNAPAEWNAMFGNIENNFAPWKLSPDDRDKWAIEMNS